MILRPYQQITVDTLWDSLHSELNSLCQAPCGAGKTIVMSHLIKKLLAENPEFRVLILADVEIIVRQTQDKLCKVAPELMNHIGIVCASISNTKHIHRAITIASRQSLINHLNRFEPVQLCIVDEIHAVDIPMEGKEPDQFGQIINTLRQYNPKMRLLGFTATPYRLNQGHIYGDKNSPGCMPYFPELTHKITVEELQGESHLVPLTGKIAAPENMEEALSSVGTIGGEYNLGRLENLMSQDVHINSAVNVWQEHAHDRKKTLAFCVSIKHAELMAEAFNQAGIPAHAIHSELDDMTSYARMKALNDGTARVFTSVAKLTKGLDVTDIDCILMARPTMSTALYVQCLDKNTEILTNEGWKGIGDDIETTMIASYDITDGNVSWQYGIRVERELGDESMVGIVSPHLDIRVTSGHRMVVAKRRGGHGKQRYYSQWFFEEAGNISGGVSIPVSGVISIPDADIPDSDITFLGLLLTDGCLNNLNDSIVFSQSEKNLKVIKLVNETLVKCGFKFGHSIKTTPSNFGERSPLHIWWISKGAPRGRDKHLTGWGRLSEWVGDNGKRLSKKIEQLSPRQVGILLDAMIAGNGCKHVPTTWERHTQTLVVANDILADSLQALFVLRGYRCNKAILSHTTAVLLHISKDSQWTLKTSSSDSRPVWGQIPSTSSEKVWCVTVPTGAIITRRNGKVAVVGNCLGRGARPATEKTDCLVLDMVGNGHKHGTDLDKPKVRWNRGGKKGEKANSKECPECAADIHPACRVCPECGYEYPAKDFTDTDAPDMVDAKYGAKPPMEMRVMNMFVDSHLSKKDDIEKALLRIRLELETGQTWRPFISASMWVCLPDYYSGFAVSKGRAIWQEMASGECPKSIREALDRKGEIRMPDIAIVDVSGRWPEVKGIRYETYTPQAIVEDDSDIPF